MKKLIVISILIIAGMIFYNQIKIPNYVKINQEMVLLCTYSDVECD